jgi:hypothetical protein
MKKILFTVAAVAALAISPAAFGQAAQTEQSFSSADTDKDGFVSLTELQVLFPDYDQARIDQIDANADGMLDETEFASLEGAPESLVDDDTEDNSAS